MKNGMVFDSMKAEAASKGLPKNFTDDLFVHDKALVEREDCPAEFGWILRQNGTQFIVPGSTWSRCQIDYWREMALHELAFFYLVDTTQKDAFFQVCSCSPDEMLQWYKEATEEAEAAPFIASAKDFAREYNCKTYVIRNLSNKYAFTSEEYLQKRLWQGWRIYQEI